MSNWLQMLKEAKEALELGLIDENEFALIKQDAMAMRSQSTNPGTTTPPPSSDVHNLGTVVSNASAFEPSIPEGLNHLGTMIDQQTLSSIGNYELLGEIGQGGMGTVYRARHSVETFAQQTGDVVIKLMNPQYAQDPIFRQRFITEAATGRNIQHPNVVRIHDVIVEEQNNILAIVMDLVEGRPLEDVIPSGGMPLKQALPIIEQLSGALDHLHSTGIIHRDLKPENIIVSPDGKPVILDMGIAKNTDSNLKMTLTSTAMGTPLYMAPEQTDAKNVTSAADRYAFGLIVYQMLSGLFPWDGSSGPGMITAYKMMGNLTPLKEVQQVPGFVSDAVMKLLRANPGDRWDSCADFLNVFVESEEDRAKRLAAERAEQERIERERKAAEEKARKLAEEKKRQEELKAEQERKAREEAERKRKEEEEQRRLTEEGDALYQSIEELLENASDEVQQESDYKKLSTTCKKLLQPTDGQTLQTWVKKLTKTKSGLPNQLSDIAEAREKRLEAEKIAEEERKRKEAEERRLTKKANTLYKKLDKLLNKASYGVKQESAFETLSDTCRQLRTSNNKEIQDWLEQLTKQLDSLPSELSKIERIRNERLEAERKEAEEKRKREENVGLGSWSLIEEIGHGSMGTVYKARHNNVHIAEVRGDVAIKVIHPHLIKNSTSKARFIKEALLGQSLQHPNIAHVVDIIEEDDVLALVMEYIEGKELNEFISSTGLSIESVVYYLQPIALALDYLHNQGIVHRDIKPVNVRVKSDGTSVILDLGIAKDINDLTSITITGQPMGTQIYMAPEQMDAQVVTGAADQYALAMMAYQMLSGRLPWDEGLSNIRITMVKFTGGFNSLAELDGLSKSVNNAVMKGLSLKPGDRFESCTELIHAIYNAGSSVNKKVLEAKELFDLGLIDEEEFEMIKSEIFSSITSDDLDSQLEEETDVGGLSQEFTDWQSRFEANLEQARKLENILNHPNFPFKNNRSSYYALKQEMGVEKHFAFWDELFDANAIDVSEYMGVIRPDDVLSGSTSLFCQVCGLTMSGKFCVHCGDGYTGVQGNQNKVT